VSQDQSPLNFGCKEKTMSKWMAKLIEKYSEVNEKKKLDPVGQADADIDNDGDVDKSDKYLHNRRKAIGKAMKNEEKDMSEMCCKNCGDKFGEPKSESCMYDAYNAEGKNWIKMENYKEDVDLEEATISAKMARRALASVKAQPKDKVSLKKAPWDKEKKKVDEEEVVMNPKKEKDKKAEAETMANESVLPPVYARIMENRAKHMKGATPPEGMMDNSKSSKGAMDMVNQPKEINNDDEKGHDDVSKAGRVGPTAKARQGDNMKGDKKVIPSATPMKGK
jgi:hypothetical protein